MQRRRRIELAKRGEWHLSRLLIILTDWSLAIAAGSTYAMKRASIPKVTFLHH